MKPGIIILFFFSVFLPVVRGQNEKQPSPGPLVARVGDTGFVQVRAESFDSLTAQQKSLAYWLTQASIAIDPIIYDQLSRFGLRQKRLLEEIVAHPAGIAPKTMMRLTEFAELFWGNRGNHNENTSQKFVPTLNFDEFKQAALTAQRNGAMKTVYGDLRPLATPAQLTKELEDLRASLFDPAFEPMITAKSPKPGEDILKASSNTFYEGVALAELKDFHEQHRLNSRVIKDRDG